MKTRPRVEKATEYGSAASWWVEYPDGLVDLSRSAHLHDVNTDGHLPSNITVSEVKASPERKEDQVDIDVDGERRIRIDPKKSALVVVDMQNLFLHPDLRDHPKGLKCVDPLLDMIPPLRKAGVKIVWVNWGLTEHELQTIPPSLVRGFTKLGRSGFGAELPGGFGPLLMRGAKNSDLYGPLQDEYEKGKGIGTDVWIHKNRMSGIWGAQTSLDLYLQEEGVTTLFMTGVNADQASSSPTAAENPRPQAQLCMHAMRRRQRHPKEDMRMFATMLGTAMGSLRTLREWRKELQRGRQVQWSRSIRHYTEKKAVSAVQWGQGPPTGRNSAGLADLRSSDIEVLCNGVKGHQPGATPQGLPTCAVRTLYEDVSSCDYQRPRETSMQVDLDSAQPKMLFLAFNPGMEPLLI
ncbi:Isochorismatase hydrolase [Sanghuangporus baumii]|uniref:Isochorismatase hydrolase n=1 Tax=Sanghuangporus baumii TaxID=108892 RepID=A0A9Q5HU79_SANBA|nr:Isochorismatase hydrolase [Sanghuangporus baumii]